MEKYQVKLTQIINNVSLLFQALQDENELWNRSSAISWLVNHQNPDGGFFDVPTTAEVILALADKGLGSVREIECDSTIRGMVLAPLNHLRFSSSQSFDLKILLVESF